MTWQLWGGIVDVVGGWGGGGRRCAAGHEKGGEGLGQRGSLPKDRWGLTFLLGPCCGGQEEGLRRL